MRKLIFYDKFGNEITSKQFYKLLYPSTSKYEHVKKFMFGYNTYYERITFVDNEPFIVGEIKIIY